jgi:hypothetical protein
MSVHVRVGPALVSLVNIPAKKEGIPVYTEKGSVCRSSNDVCMAQPRQDALFAAHGRAKTSFSLTAEAKFQLATLKSDLRREGLPATESSIVEALIGTARADERLLAALRHAHSVRRPGRRSASQV